MQCPLPPSPLSCSVRRESCNQTEEALRSSSCYKYSAVSLELVSLRKEKTTHQSRFIAASYANSPLCVPRWFALMAVEPLPRELNDQQAWDHLNHPVLLSSMPVGHCFMESQTFSSQNKLNLMLSTSIGLLQSLLFS